MSSPTFKKTVTQLGEKLIECKTPENTYQFQPQEKAWTITEPMLHGGWRVINRCVECGDDAHYWNSHLCEKHYREALRDWEGKHGY